MGVWLGTIAIVTIIIVYHVCNTLGITEDRGCYHSNTTIRSWDLTDSMMQEDEHWNFGLHQVGSF